MRLAAKLIILDINLGSDQANGVDAYRWLRAQEFTGGVCFLTGHARRHPLLLEVAKTGAVVLEKPVRSSDHRCVQVFSKAATPSFIRLRQTPASICRQP